MFTSIRGHENSSRETCVGLCEVELNNDVSVKSNWSWERETFELIVMFAFRFYVMSWDKL